MKNFKYGIGIFIFLLIVFFVKKDIVIYAADSEGIARGTAISEFKSMEEAYRSVLNDNGDYTRRIYQIEVEKEYFEGQNLKDTYGAYKNKKPDRFCLCDLNSDGIQELLVVYDVVIGDGLSDVYVYTYKQNQLFYVGYLYEYHRTLAFNKEDKILSAMAVYRGHLVYGFVFDGNTIERKYWSDYVNDGPGRRYCTIEGKQVAESEYDEYTNKYFSYKEKNLLEQLNNDETNQNTYFKISEKIEKPVPTQSDVGVIEASDKQTDKEKVLADFALSSFIYNLNPLSDMTSTLSGDGKYRFYYYHDNKNPKISDLYSNVYTAEVLFQIDNESGNKVDITGKMLYDSYIKNYQFLVYGEAESCGMQAAAFLTPENEIVIVFRGTDKDKWVDWETDIGMGFKQNIEQYTYAEHFYQDIYIKYISGTNRSLRLTGHSLGGALAAYLSMHHDLPCIGINDASGFVIDSAYRNDPYAIEKFEGIEKWKYYCYVNMDDSAFNNLVTGDIIKNRTLRKILKISGNGYKDKGTLYTHSIESLLRAKIVDSKVQFYLPDVTVEQSETNVLEISDTKFVPIQKNHLLVLGTSKNDILDGRKAVETEITLYTGSGKDVVYGSAFNDVIVASAEGAKTFFGGNGDDTYIIDSIYVKSQNDDIRINDTVGNNKLHIKNTDVTKLDIKTSDDDYYFKLNGGTIYIHRDFEKNSSFYLVDGIRQVELSDQAFETNRRNFDIKKISFLFGNQASWFGYTKPYKFDLNVYKTVFGDTKQAKKIYEKQENWHGSCFGIVAASTLLYEKNNGYSVKDFDPNCENMYDLNAHVQNKEGVSIKQIVEYMQVLQAHPNIKKLKVRNGSTSNCIETVLNKIKNFEVTDVDPIIICVTTKEGNSGHALFPYDVVWEGENQAKIYVYDGNYPGDDTCYIQVNGNTWSYSPYNDQNCSISYLDYSDLYKQWGQMGEKYYSVPGLLMIDSVYQAKVYDSSGNIVAVIEDGIIKKVADTITPYSCCICEEEIGDSKEPIWFWVPSGTYTVVNANTDNMTVTMADGNYVSEVETTCQKVQVCADNANKKSSVTIADSETGSYKITVENSIDSKVLEGTVNKKAVVIAANEKNISDNLSNTEENDVENIQTEATEIGDMQKENENNYDNNKDYDSQESVSSVPKASKKLKIKKFIVKAKSGRKYILIKSSVSRINITVKHQSRKYKKTIKRFIYKKKKYYYLGRRLKKGDRIKVTVRKVGYKTKTKKIKVK